MNNYKKVSKELLSFMQMLQIQQVSIKTKKILIQKMSDFQKLNGNAK